MPPRDANVDAIVSNACGWTDEFVKRLATPAVVGDDAEGETALDYAWRKYGQIEADKEKMNAKDEALMRHAGAIALGVFTAVKVAGLQIGGLFWASIACFLACFVFALHGRRTLNRKSRPSVRDVIDGCRDVPERKWWTAAVLHGVVEAQGPHAEWQMRMNNWATNAFMGGVVLMFTALYFAKPATEFPAAGPAAAAPSAVAEPADVGALGSTADATEPASQPSPLPPPDRPVE